MKAKKMDRRLYQQHPGQKQQFKGQTDSWMHNMVKKDETNWGRTGQRMGGDEWLKRYEATEQEEEEVDWGGVAATLRLKP